MTTFERDYQAINQDATEAKEILMKRQARMNALKKEQRTCKNKFRWTCIQQELDRLEHEYRVLDQLV